MQLEQPKDNQKAEQTPKNKPSKDKKHIPKFRQHKPDKATDSKKDGIDQNNRSSVIHPLFSSGSIKQDIERFKKRGGLCGC